MPAAAGTTLCHTVQMIVRDGTTGRERFARAEYHRDGGRAWAVVEFDDGTFEPCEVDPGVLAWWRARLFPDGPDDGRALAAIVGIDGEPALTPVQEAMRRARARRQPVTPEAFAAD